MDCLLLPSHHFPAGHARPLIEAHYQVVKCCRISLKNRWANAFFFFFYCYCCCDCYYWFPLLGSAPHASVCMCLLIWWKKRKNLFIKDTLDWLIYWKLVNWFILSPYEILNQSKGHWRLTSERLACIVVIASGVVSFDIDQLVKTGRLVLTFCSACLSVEPFLGGGVLARFFVSFLKHFFLILKKCKRNAFSQPMAS